MATTRVVTATYRKPDSTPCSGYVRISPTTTVADSAGDLIIAQSPVRIDLDEEGHLEVTLVTTDSPGTSPEGWAYEITEVIKGSPARQYLIEVPSGTGPLDLADVAPLTDVDEQVTYVLASTVGQPGGPAGPLDSAGKLPASQLPESGDHNHDGVYSPIGHDHDDRYSPLGHEHDYADTDHTHDGVYAPAVHDHDGQYAPASHAHDYAPTDHDHDEDYVSTSGGSVIIVPGISTQAWRVHIPAGDRAAAVDTAGFYVNRGTEQAPDWRPTWYWNEYGEGRANPSDPTRVALRLKGLFNQIADLLQIIDIDLNEIFGVHADGTVYFRGLELVGDDFSKIPAAPLVVLEGDVPVPPGTPAGTVILRRV